MKVRPNVSTSQYVKLVDIILGMLEKHAVVVDIFKQCSR